MNTYFIFYCLDISILYLWHILCFLSGENYTTGVYGQSNFK